MAQDWLIGALTGFANPNDPLAYARDVRQNRLADILNLIKLKQMQQEQEPFTLQREEKVMLPSGGVSTQPLRPELPQPSGEIPPYDIPTGETPTNVLRQIPTGLTKGQVGKIDLGDILKMVLPGQEQAGATTWGTYHKTGPKAGQPIFERKTPLSEKAPSHKTETVYDSSTGRKYEQSYDWVNGQWTPVGERRLVGEREEHAPGSKVEKEFEEKTGRTYEQRYEWKNGKWEKVGERRVVGGLGPASPSSTAGKIAAMDKLFQNYNVARLKAPADPMRLQMIQTMKTMGIDVPVSLPELNREEFDTFVGTGKLPNRLTEIKLKPITKKVIDQIKKHAKTREEAEQMSKEMGYDPYTPAVE